MPESIISPNNAGEAAVLMTPRAVTSERIAPKWVVP